MEAEFLYEMLSQHVLDTIATIIFMICCIIWIFKQFVLFSIKFMRYVKDTDKEE